MRGVIDELPDRPLMLLLSHRPDVRPPHVALAAHSVIRLAPLSLGRDACACRRAVRLVARRRRRKELQNFVAARSGGNPFFVEEIIRSLMGKGVLDRQGDHWTCTAAFEAGTCHPHCRGCSSPASTGCPPRPGACCRTPRSSGPSSRRTLLRAVAD